MDGGQMYTEQALKRLRKRYAEVYKQAFDEISEKAADWEDRHRARVAKNQQKLKDGKITQEDYDAWMRGQIFQSKQWDAKADSFADSMVHADEAIQAMINRERMDVFAANANWMSYSIEHDAGYDFGFGLYDTNTVAILLRDQPDLLPPKLVRYKADKAWYQKRITNCITQGILQGEGLDDIVKRIMKDAQEGSYSMAVRNARTAMTGAQNAGRIEGMLQAERLGIEVKKHWMCTLDFKTRDTHRELDGQEVYPDEFFEVEGDTIRFPGDPHAKPDLVQNCRCTLTYAHPKYPSSIPRVDNIDGERVGDMTWYQWFEKKGQKYLDKYEQPETKPKQITFDEFAANESFVKIEQKNETGIEALRSVAENSTDKYDFWMSLDEDQQAIFKASGMSIEDAYNSLKGDSKRSEWKTASPGGPESFGYKHDFSGDSIRFERVKAKSDGWMADANGIGVINIRDDGLGEDWEYVISHEAGHQISNIIPGLGSTIMSNPGDVFGRYNTRLMAFDGVYGEYNPEEAFATCVSNYVRHPESMKEKYPEAYKAIDNLFTASPSARKFVEDTMEAYRKEFGK